MIEEAEVIPIVEIEVQLLLEGVYQSSGFDFRNYAPGYVRRRIADRVRSEGVRSISGLQEAILHDRAALDRFVYAMSVVPSEPFADAAFFADLRRAVVPALRTYASLRLWVVGCGTGEDVYSLAIALREEDLSGRCRIYATDLTSTAITAAKAGRYPLDDLEEARRRYEAAGGTGSLHDYLEVEDGIATFSPELRKKVVFSTHSLATDSSFNEFNLIVSRNVLTQLNRTLAARAHQIFYESLARSGYLGLGTRDDVRYSPHQRCYEPVPGAPQLYRRVR
jgi:chemotaxis protein methyltransferase CheR